MNMDVEKMAPWVRDYYINKQKKMATMKARTSERSGLRVFLHAQDWPRSVVVL
jgi:hypothetical protein